MKISVGAQGTPHPDATLVRFVPNNDRAALPESITTAEFSAAPNSVLHLHHERTLFVGIGAPDAVAAQTTRSAAGTAVMFLRKVGRVRAEIALGERTDFIGAAVEGAILANYRFEKFRPAKTKPLTHLHVTVSAANLARARRETKRAETLATATNYAREIANLPGNVLYPETLAAEAKRTAKEHGLTATVLDERALREGAFGGLIAVGSGSAHGPRLIVLEHRGSPRGQAPIALVGKAVTFDSGGVSIKAAANMEEMIFDKCGGIAVLGAMCGIARLGLKRNVVGIIASAENLLSSTAYRPGDIVTAYDGKHIEIINTDAEGRVVLADAIAYARKDKGAAAIIDLATLTGACGIALGDHAAGLWSTSDELKNAVMAAAEKTGERVWPMPLFPEYEEQIRSNVALVKNTGGRPGGACTAAAFLKVFADPTPWAHLDIAYTASRETDRSDMARGATGYGVRLLIELMHSWR